MALFWLGKRDIGLAFPTRAAATEHCGLFGDDLYVAMSVVAYDRLAPLPDPDAAPVATGQTDGEAVPRCPRCGHMPHASGACLNMASDNDCACGDTERPGL